MSKKDLKELLKTVKVIKSAETMFDKPIIEPYMFCPECGCREMESFGNKVFYPEHYEKFYYVGCENLVAYIDNSPFIHALECENFKI